jgi:hypothetical protein
MGVIDEAAIDRLFLVSELTKHICVHTKSSEEPAVDASSAGSSLDSTSNENLSHEDAELSDFFPPMMWLLRDFVVSMEDADGNALNPTQYLEVSMYRGEYVCIDNYVV